MAFISYIEGSKRSYGIQHFDGSKVNLDHEQINIGCMQRIAAAAESQAESMKVMAANHVRIQNDLDLYRRWYNEERAKKERLQRQVSSLRGVITKKDNLIKQLKDGSRHTDGAPAAPEQV